MFSPADRSLGWTKDGDLLKYKEGNSIAEVIGFNSLARRIMFLLRTDPGEYEYNPSLGIGLENYAGRANTKDNREQIRKAIFDNLAELRTTYPYHFDVQVKKVGRHDVGISMDIIGPNVAEQLNIVFDLRNGHLKKESEYVIDTTTKEKITLPHGQEENENIYLNRKRS